MQILERPKTASGAAPKKNRRKPFLPQLCVFLIIAGIIWPVAALGASGFLIVCGVCGVGIACKTAMHMNFGQWSISQRAKRVLTALWLVVTIGLSISFIVSGAIYAMGGPIGAYLAGIESKRSVFATLLFILWLIGAFPARRAGIIHILLWTAAVFETARLLAFGLHPTGLSYTIWAATLAAAFSCRLFVNRPEPRRPE